MKEGIPQLSGPWGTAYFNELEQAVFRYAPPPPAERSAAGMQPLTANRFGNASVAALACGDGRLYPLVSTEGHLVSLCGDPFVPPQVAGNRVFVMEGGLVHPVVGPDHPLSDRSDMICAATQLFASGIEGEVVTPDLAARCRVTVPLEGTPTLLVWMEVFNHSQGTRWVTLWNLWRFMPVVLESRFVRRVPLAHRLAAVVGMAGKELVDNGYFSLTTEGGGSRIQVSTSWDAANAELHWKGVRPVHVPPIQVVAMTRNIVLGASGIPQQLQSTLASETNRDSESGSAVLVSMRAAFEVRSQDRQVGAVAIHLADWDRAKAGLKRLLPFAMHRENEGIVHRKRFACSVERARQGQREVDRWQGVWQAAAAGALALT
ncbi:MAG: hypothetical protein FJ109_09540, partial [Deltaproteobacteria bacterium]|nr:hypothetical protein [Deltaproteobacteria bacterium]